MVQICRSTYNGCRDKGGGKYARRRVSVPFQNGRPRRFRAEPSSLHQQGAATRARYASGWMWSEPMKTIIDEGLLPVRVGAEIPESWIFPKTGTLLIFLPSFVGLLQYFAYSRIY